MCFIKIPRIAVFNLLGCLLFLAACTQESPDLIETKRVVLKSQHPGAQILRLANTGSQIAVFSLKINDGFYSSTIEMLAAIKAMSPLEAEESEQKKAWRFIVERVAHDKPLSDRNWQQNPMVLINSIGFGQCGHKAAALVTLWEELGFKCRIWDLGGHAVPEVYVDERWEMYDPDLETYYLNQEGKVAGVEELEHEPTLITRQQKASYNNASLYSELQRNSDYTAELYATKEDNQLLKMQESKDRLMLLEFQIPAQGSLEFPAIFEPRLTVPEHNNRTYYANAKLTIPAGWEGEIAIPLVVHSIRGIGYVKIANRWHNIGSEELSNNLSVRASFDYRLNFARLTTPIEVIYLINPKIAQLSEENVVSLKGIGLSKINLSLNPTPDSLALNFCKVLSSFALNDKIVQQMNLPDTIEGPEDLQNLIVQYIGLDTGLPQEAKADRIILLQNKLDNVLKRVDMNVLAEKILPRLNDDSLLLLCLDYIMNKPEDEFMDLLCAFEDR